MQRLPRYTPLFGTMAPPFTIWIKVAFTNLNIYKTHYTRINETLQPYSTVYGESNEHEISL